MKDKVSREYRCSENCVDFQKVECDGSNAIVFIHTLNEEGEYQICPYFKPCQLVDKPAEPRTVILTGSKVSIARDIKDGQSFHITAEDFERTHAEPSSLDWLEELITNEIDAFSQSLLGNPMALPKHQERAIKGIMNTIKEWKNGNI